MNDDYNDEFMMRLLMAIVRKMGGKVTLTEAEVQEAGNFSMEFSPELGKKKVKASKQKIILTVGEYTEPEEECVECPLCGMEKCNGRCDEKCNGRCDEYDHDY
jgi:hypothetical protein